MVKPPLRTKSIGFKVSEEEYVRLETAAQAEGRTLGEWCREVVLASGQETKPTGPSGAETQALMAELVALRAILLHFRKPTPTEAEVIQRLLAADFPGRQEIVKQLDGCRVRIIDDEGSLELELSDAAKPAVVEKRIPVEADAVDEDGIHVHFLLHVVKGFAKELEVYKDRCQRERRDPDRRAE